MSELWIKNRTERDLRSCGIAEVMGWNPVGASGLYL